MKLITGFLLLGLVAANPVPLVLSEASVQSKSVSIPPVSYTKSYRPVETVRAVTSYKPVLSYKPVTEYRTETSYQAELAKHHSTQQVQVHVVAGKGHRVLNPIIASVSKVPVHSKASAVQSKTVTVPRVSYSKSYRPVQTVRPVTSYKPVVTYEPVTEYHTKTSYQPLLTKRHSSQNVQIPIASSKGRRLLNPVPVAVSKVPVTVSVAPVMRSKTVTVPRVSYSKSYRPVQTVRPVTSYKPVVTYKPVTEFRTETSYQPQLTKHHSNQQVQVQFSAPPSSKSF